MLSEHHVLSLLENLPFVGTRKRVRPGQFPRSFWHLRARTGDYLKDCDLGAKFALEYLRYEEAIAAEGRCHSILAAIVKDMPRKLGGVEIGFLQTIGNAAAVGRQRAEQLVASDERIMAEFIAEGA